MSYLSEVQADSAFIHLRMLEASGQAVNSGTAGATYNCNIENGVTLEQVGAITSESPNKCFLFDGVNDQLTTVNGVTEFNGASTLTVEMWVKTTDSGATIAACSNGAGIFRMDLDAFGKPVFIIWSGGSTSITGATSINDGSWHHLVGVLDLNLVGDDLKIYVDGALDSQGTWPGTNLNSPTSEIWIGAENGSSAINAYIDDFACYSTALSAARVLAHYNAAASGGNTAPSTPTITNDGTNGQFKSDATTQLAVGAINTSTTMVLKGTATDAESTWKLEVEVQPVGTPFTDTPTHTGSTVASGATSSVTVAGLTAGQEYHWQARATDTDGTPLSSAWVSFGANPEANVDFEITADPDTLTATPSVVLTNGVASTGAKENVAFDFLVTASDANGWDNIANIDITAGLPGSWSKILGAITQVNATTAQRLITLTPGISDADTDYQLTFRTTDAQGNFEELQTGLFAVGNDAPVIGAISDPAPIFEGTVYSDLINVAGATTDANGHELRYRIAFTQQQLGAATYSIASPSVFSYVGHGYAPNDYIYVRGVTGDIAEGLYRIDTTPDADTFTIETLLGVPVNSTTGGSCTIDQTVPTPAFATIGSTDGLADFAPVGGDAGVYFFFYQSKDGLFV